MAEARDLGRSRGRLQPRPVPRLSLRMSCPSRPSLTRPFPSLAAVGTWLPELELAWQAQRAKH